MNRVSALCLAVVLVSSCVLSERPYAEQQGREYAQGLGMNDATVICVDQDTDICVDQDTDSDGYVSCTVSDRRQNGDVKLHSIECAAVRKGCNANSGCRLPKNRVLTDQ